MKTLDIIIKDLKIMISDKKALALTILMPIVLITILSFALKGAFTDGTNTNKIEIAVVKKYDLNEDMNKLKDTFTNGIMSDYISLEQLQDIMKSTEDFNIEEILMDDFLENKELKKILKYSITDEEKALKLLKDKKVSAIVVLPEEFVYDMSINFLTPFRNKIDIKVVGHPDRKISMQIVEGIMEGFADMTSSIIIGKNVFIETAAEQNISNQAYENFDKIIEGMTNNIENQRVNIEYEKLKGKTPITSAQYYAVAMASMFILFAAGYGGKLLLEEKDNITYQRMIVAGISKWNIMAGKFFTILIFTLIQIGVLMIFSKLALGVKWGNTLNVLAITLCTALSIAGLGILIAVISFVTGNYKFGDVFQAGIIQVMALLGGSFMPIEIFPKFMQKLSMFTLNGLALKSYLKIMTGHGFKDITIYLLYIVAMGILFVIISVYILKMNEEASRNVKHFKIKANKPA